MSWKVKRGLGLLVVAAIGYLIVNAGQESTSSGTVLMVTELVGWLAVAVGLVGGLILLAWGLLRD